MKARLLLISQPNSYRIAAYIKAAMRLNLDTIIASEGQYSLISEVSSGIHVNLADIESATRLIIKEASRQPFSGVLGSDDSTVELAARVARELNLPHNPPEAARISRRKDLARAHLAQSGCPVPYHRLVSLNKPVEPQIHDLPWPCVLKPLAMSASRGVIRANNKAEFLAACSRVKSIIAELVDPFEQSHILVEQYIHGLEVAYEGYLYQKQLYTLALFDKPDPLHGPYFTETIYVTPSRLENSLQERIHQIVQHVCHTYGLTTGPVHAELRIDDLGHIWILEVASRTIGGDCARMLDNREGYELEMLTVALASRLPYEVNTPRESRGVMMIPVEQSGILRRIEGLSEARKTPYIDHIEMNVTDGHELIPLPEGNQYAGYIFASAETPQKVTSALKKAHSKIKLVTAPMLVKSRLA